MKEDVEGYRIPNPGNIPAARQSPLCWVDSKETLWVGYGENEINGTIRVLGDLWKYENQTWTLMSPPLSDRVNITGVSAGYGIERNTSYPGSRYLSHSWIDKEDNLWIFGGTGFSELGLFGSMNDMWKFNGQNWILMNGTTTGEGVYGDKGVPSNSNIPGARSQGSTWTDKSGNFYLFGGLGFDENQNTGYLSDLWKFNGSMWTWLGGSKEGYSPIMKPSGNETNLPLQRVGAALWTDSKGLIWIYGGYTFNLTNSPPYSILSDTWTYDGNNWTKVGDYGLDFYSTDLNIPSIYSSWWTDDADILYMFGGLQRYKDVIINNQNTWKFDGVNWTLLGGNPLSPVQPGIYGVLGTKSENNIPGSRNWAASCQSLKGDKFYMMGGNGMDRLALDGQLNDVWTLSRTNSPIVSDVTSVTSDPIPTDEIRASSESQSDNLPVIVGVTVGVIAFALLVFIGVFFIVRRKRRNDEPLDGGSTVELASLADITNVEIHEKLGGGNFGEVYRGTWQGATVALKLLKNEDKYKEFLSEVLMLKNLNHPNIVRYLGTHEANGKHYIVTEYLAKGNLKDLLMKNTLITYDLILMAKQVAAGMKYLEQKNVVHRDLAARNILCAKGDDERFDVKVADFGLSRATEGTNYYKSDDTKIPVKWSAPEVLEYGKSTSK